MHLDHLVQFGRSDKHILRETNSSMRGGTLVVIRERTFLELLDLSLATVRRRPVALGLAAAAGIAPFAALNAWLAGFSDWTDGWYLLLWLFESPWATAPLTVVLGGMMFGERLSARQVTWRVVRSTPGLFVYQTLLRGLSMIVGITYLFFSARQAFLNEVLLLEGGSFGRAMKRSTALCAQRGGEFLGQWLARIGFGLAFVVCFWLGTRTLLGALTTNTLTWRPVDETPFADPLIHFAVWLAIAFMAITRFFGYIDQRIRLEGWEVELRLRAVGRAQQGSLR